MRTALCTLVLLLAAPAALACINDHEVRRAEQEFHKSYDDEPSTRPVAEKTNLLPWTAAGVGAVLLVLAFRQAVRDD